MAPETDEPDPPEADDEGLPDDDDDMAPGRSLFNESEDAVEPNEPG